MEEMILKLYKELGRIEEDFLDYQKRKDLVPIQKCLERIQKFAVWFMEENRLEEETFVWEELNRCLLGVLQDIVQAIDEQDYVLMHDAITYGLMEYLEIFLPVLTEESK